MEFSAIRYQHLTLFKIGALCGFLNKGGVYRFKTYERASECLYNLLEVNIGDDAGDLLLKVAQMTYPNAKAEIAKAINEEVPEDDFEPVDPVEESEAEENGEDEMKATSAKAKKATPKKAEKVAKVAKAAKAVRKAVEKDEVELRSPSPLKGRRGKHSGRKIFPLVEENTRRTGTHGHKSLQIVIDNPGLTYEEYISLGGRSNDLAWDENKGNLEVRD